MSVQAQRPRDQKPRRAGPGRVKVHIILFFVLGALALGLGIHGRALLQGRTQSMADEIRLATHLDEGSSLVQAALKGKAEELGIFRQVSQGLSSRKRSLRTSIKAMIDQGLPDADIAAQASQGMLEAALSRVEDQDHQALLHSAFDQQRAALTQRLAAQSSQQAQDLSLSQVRLGLKITQPNYPLMYYYTPLLALGVFLLLLALALLFVYLKSDTEKRARLGQRLEPMDYLLPFFIGVFAFTLYPMVRVVIMSFQERYRLDGYFSGWGIGNFQHVLLGVPGTTNYFLQGLSNTLLYVAFTVPLTTVLAILIAYLLNQKLRFSSLFQTGYFLPMVTSVTAVGLVWRWIFNSNFGLLNAILGFFGVAPIDWLMNASNSLAVLVIFGVWSSLPFTIILLLSGLQNIDENFYTVARVDGARAVRIFRRITVPLLAPTIGLVLIINSISAFKVFTDVTVLFGGNPGPYKNMYTVVYYIYDQMYENRELGRAAAAALVLFLFILAFTMLQRFIQRRWRYE